MVTPSFKSILSFENPESQLQGSEGARNLVEAAPDHKV